MPSAQTLFLGKLTFRYGITFSGYRKNLNTVLQVLKQECGTARNLLLFSLFLTVFGLDFSHAFSRLFRNKLREDKWEEN